jgi:hypothetical protein
LERKLKARELRIEERRSGNERVICNEITCYDRTLTRGIYDEVDELD